MGSPHFLTPHIGDLDLSLHALTTRIMFLPLAFRGRETAAKAAFLGWKHFRTLPNSFGPVLLPRRLHKYYNPPGSSLVGLNEMKQAGTSHQGDTHS